MFDLAAIQSAVREQHLDGWLLYDFRNLNVLAARVAKTNTKLSRRWAYFIPASGQPRKLVHAIEPASLDHLPGDDKTVYLRWQEFEQTRSSTQEFGNRTRRPYSCSLMPQRKALF